MSSSHFYQHIGLPVRYCVAENKVPFVIRLADSSDAHRIEQNIIAICAEQKYLHTDTFVCTDEWETLLAQSIDWERRQLLLVAVVNESVVGHARLFPLWFGSKGRHVANLGVALVRSWREIGIGTALVAHLLEWAIRLSYLKASVEVIGTNQRAINLFRKFGFVEEGWRSNHIIISGKYCDEVLMGLDISQYAAWPFEPGNAFYLA